MQPTKCKYCGCEEVATKTDSEIVFFCGSSRIVSVGLWRFSINCGARCVEQLVELRGQVQQAIEILRGNCLESPDSAPVTTDDLAASDYYEAVRQRVPWMTSIEHIEGLVEGYRRCGVMVWQTAEEIRKVHGGEYERAD